ncbi:MAG: PQQ-like beta-propeller repeat protein [Planctomycetaceae bacterium]|nr:PQQ-like beta-propeller repeat protein [Planctomycetaceae bacterium]
MVYKKTMAVALLTAFVINRVPAASAHDSNAHWAHWRGPTANGQAAASASPVISWNTTKNVGWVTDLPGEGTSTPIVWGDRIFVLAAEPTDRPALTPAVQRETSKTIAPDVFYRFLVICLDRRSSEILWQRTAIEAVPHEGHHPTHTYAGSSPTTDGMHVYVSFGSRGIFCYTLDGDLVWTRDLGDMQTRYGWGEAVTPVLAGDSLIVNWDQEEGSFITSLDTATGTPNWTTPREREVTSWNTPLVTGISGRTIIVANGTHLVRGYDAATGRQLWSCGGQTVNAIPSPVRFEDSVIVMSGYRGALAVSLPLNSAGNLSPSAASWSLRRGTPYVPSPLLSDDRLYFTAGNGNVLSVVNARTGATLAAPTRLSALRSLYASPVATQNHIYVLDRQGTCAVLTNAAEPEVVAVNKLNDATDASPVIVEDQLFIRSWTKLYCLQADQ